ncbi:MAG TPA: hypothetical protein VFR12_00485, partial [Pyrinomonadaceae bacterium]|nr:hypothetical protein [Pyrinomonadaceae bacterium]
MPDWFYRTVSQPLLFRLPAPRARNFALGFMGRLSRLPFGPLLIDFLGHMRADPRLRKSLFEIEFPAAVGLGPWLDTRLAATEALSRFGVGFIEIGPVRLQGSAAAKEIKRIRKDEALWIADEPDTISLHECNRRLHQSARLKVPLIVRLDTEPSAVAPGPDEDLSHLIGELDRNVRLISLGSLTSAVAHHWSIDRWSTHLDAALTAAHGRGSKLLLTITADQDFDTIAPLLDDALARGIAGFIIDGSIAADPEGRLIGLPARTPALQLLRRLRERYDVPIIASGGIHEPEHALEFLSAGASLIQVDTGLIYTGPGLPKRINDCLLFEATRNATPADPPPRPSELTWFWTTLMGAGMMIGGVLALVIAATKVVLPYDEAFLGMTITALTSINPRLLAFMAHDRVTLAGVMVAIGLLYVGFSVFGMRRGLHWARQSVLISAFTGFVSFFLFLGFGYLDTFHAFVTAALLQLLLMGVHARLGVYVPASRPDLRGDRAWRLSLWGQLLLVI